MEKTHIKILLNDPTFIGQEVCVKGWVRNKRISKEIAFIMLNDGSSIHPLQVVIDPTKKILSPILKDIQIGGSLTIMGTINISQGGGQSIELKAEKITVLGTAVDYPLQPKKHSAEFLREIAHLRCRTNTFSAIFRLRHAISYAIHHFFFENGFYYVHTPIITATDAEGAGEMFSVTSLDMEKLPKNKAGDIDFKQDFFGEKANLTVSGQLEAEALAMGLGNVYTFGPTFRAENSNTKRHLAEFWMVEPEMAFYDLQDNIELAEAFLKYIIRFVLENYPEDIAFLDKRSLEKGQHSGNIAPYTLWEKLQYVMENPFEKITYSEAIELLKVSPLQKKNKFEFPIKEWGIDLQSEHERYLVENYFKKPVIITNYPSTIKAFYMRQNEDEKTVAAMDVLVPGIGEIIGGSQREERLDKLEMAVRQRGINSQSLQWYLDLRRFGTVPHSGFGLGLERLVLFITGMDNIRDVIAFPRTPGNIAF